MRENERERERETKKEGEKERECVLTGQEQGAGRFDGRFQVQ